MKTFYGVVPTLNQEGKKTGDFSPVRVNLKDRVGRRVGKALGNIRDAVNLGSDGSYDAKVFPLISAEGRSQGSISVLGTLPEGLSIPGGPYSFVIRPNNGLTKGTHRVTPIPKEGSGRWGVSEIGVNVLSGQPPHIIVRDKVLRGAPEGSMVFTPEFLKAAVRSRTTVDLSLLPEDYIPLIGRDVAQMVRNSEGGWLKRLGPNFIFRPEPLKAEGANQAGQLLEGLVHGQSISTADIGQAFVEVNKAFLIRRVEQRGSLRREAL